DCFRARLGLPQAGSARAVLSETRGGCPPALTQASMTTSVFYKLAVDNVHKQFGEHEVLKGVSLHARAGDVISIIGSSGSGKSTFLRCINFLERPTSGSIAVNGEYLHTTTDGSGT